MKNKCDELRTMLSVLLLSKANCFSERAVSWNPTTNQAIIRTSCFIFVHPEAVFWVYSQKLTGLFLEAGRSRKSTTNPAFPLYIMQGCGSEGYEVESSTQLQLEVCNNKYGCTGSEH